MKIPNSIYREVPGSDGMRPTQKTPIRNLALAGDYTQQDYMASMEGAVRSGHLAAKALITGLNSRRSAMPGTRSGRMQRSIFAAK